MKIKSSEKSECAHEWFIQPLFDLALMKCKSQLKEISWFKACIKCLEIEIYKHEN